MPLYDFHCEEHDDWEALVSRDTLTIPCPQCGADCKRLISAPAKTAGRWGDTGGKFIPALGGVYTPHQAAKVAKAKGLVHESDLPSGYIDSKLNKEWDDARQHDATMSKFKELKTQHGGDASRAWSEVFSVDNMKKQGTLKEDAANG